MTSELVVTDTERTLALDRAINSLRVDDPVHSASVALMGWQKPVFAALAVALIGSAVWQPVGTAVALVALSVLGYLLTLCDRVLIFRRGLASRPITIADDEARAIPDAELPPYTILVPAFHEPEVVGNLIRAMAALEYPPDRLQVLLLLEADDEATIAAACATTGSDAITIVAVPPAQPRTKPKACNYGLHFSDGDIVTIYDAEDLPEPLQLRRVVAAFGQLPEDVACVQAKLAYRNERQNLLTAWFTAEYALWFGYLLPGMMARNSPIPLGGTSNHLRREVLRRIGGWDPFNVTEDADLGLRLAGYGYRTAVVDSVTLEEANSDLVNWVRQRSRWYKGYLQTWLVHIRRPGLLLKALGLRNFIRYHLVWAGTPLIALVNLIFWLVTALWLLGHPAAVTAVFPWYVYFPALFSMVIGNFTAIYMGMVALREDDRADLMYAALIVPLYWVLMSVAAAKGIYQLIRQASYWEKTFHGLDIQPHDGEAEAELASSA
ncbi:glycosyltransferase [Mycolicibacterium mengxianglii]|uniref:glycosyltransferase n=1 Tax=Mycolicibacterium mengxianglii TaxID=2736649 RepID=UPI0018EEE807|nr:glycosyltransferase [Mycolicibacterium mengxianglii]